MSSSRTTGPAHRRRRRSHGSEQRPDPLGALGGRVVTRVDAPGVVPPRRTGRSGRARRYVLPVVLVLVVALISVGAGLQWSRRVPAPVFRPAMADSVTLPGTSPSPIASITKVMTAYVVLKDHPLAAGATGPLIPVTAADVAVYQLGLATQQSVLAVANGETLTEMQALEGLLIPSGNNIASLLADWDAGSSAAFVAKMNAAAQALGLSSTHFNDASGLDPGSVSTPADLIQLGQAAMSIPAFAQIVGLGEATLPVAGLVYNFDYDLGRDGIIGIKTGTDAAAGGCFLFEAQSKVDGRKVTLVGAVLGQQSSSPITTVLAEAEALAKAAFADMGSLPVLPPDHLVGRVVTAWGTSVAVTALHAPSIVGWPGLTVPARLEVGPLPARVAAGTRIGTLSIDLDGDNMAVAVRATHAVSGPSVIWRLTRR